MLKSKSPSENILKFATYHNPTMGSQYCCEQVGRGIQLERDGPPDQRTNGPTDGQSLLKSCVSAKKTKKNKDLKFISKIFSLCPQDGSSPSPSQIRDGVSLDLPWHHSQLQNFYMVIIFPTKKHWQMYISVYNTAVTNPIEMEIHLY